MNIMLSCPTGDIFLGSVDTSGNKKTKEYIAGELKELLGILDHFWDNTQLMIFPSSIFLLD